MTGKVRMIVALASVSVLSVLAALSQPAMSQGTVPPSALVVETCGVLTQDFVTARGAPLTVNKEGVLCDGAGAGGLAAGQGALVASNSGTTGAVSSTLTGTTNRFTYLCGFSIDARATAAGAVTASVTGVSGGTMQFAQAVALTPSIARTSQTFMPCLQSANTASSIIVQSGAAGAGGVTTVNAWGFR